MDSINIYVQKDDNTFSVLEVPLGIQLSLMEVLKGEGFPIEAICGGMALCGTCAVDILNQDELLLSGANDTELFLLETLTCYPGNCRLSCQIQISEGINGLKLSFLQD